MKALQKRGNVMTMQKIEQEAGKAVIRGSCASGFEGVAAAFAENFISRGEVGASVSITHEGKTVADLWGGHKAKDGAPWEEDTISIVFSCTKGAAALCAHMLADRGALDFNQPVKEIWPEFAVNGKEEATVGMMLDHSVGVPHIRAQLKDGAYYDWDYMTDLVAREEAFWKPGTRNGYHGVTFAWTVGEIVRRVAGKPLGQFFQEEVAGPLGLDFWIGLPEDKEPRVAGMINAPLDPEAPVGKFTQAILSDPASPSSLFLMNNGKADFNSRAAHEAEIGSANGITNARGLAGMYAPLANGGTLGGVKLVSPEAVTRMSRVSMATREDATLLIPTRFGLGFMKSMDNRGETPGNQSSVILSEAAFGHVGMGGSIGFADPEAGMSFGYSMNQMGMGILLNERGQAVVDAAYRAIGYRTNEGGAWTR